jgi:putative addiction module component (TIGR02574 family)
MSPAATDVLNSALALPEAERLNIAVALLDSAEQPPGQMSPDEFEVELNRRSDEIDAGTAVVIPWEVVRDEARARILGRRDG